MTLPYLTVAGSSYEQGRQHGVQLRSEVHHNLKCYVDRFHREAGLGRKDVLHRAAIYAQAIEAMHPRYFAGMRGIAEGAGLSIHEIAALNVRYEILYFQYALRQMMGARDGCTAFIVAPHKTTNGHLWLGQNWDWIPQVKGALIHSKHDDGFETLAFTEAGIFGGKIGLNSAGLGLAINGITTTDDNWQRLSSPFHVRCFDILLQRSLDDAVAVIERDVRACSANFLIGQLPELGIDVEAAPSTTKRLSWRNGCLVHTNHFVDPQSIGVEEPPDENRRFSWLRRERLEAFLEAEPVVELGQLQTWLQDHQNQPRSICRHEDPDAPVDEQYRTVTSIIIDLEERTLWATAGPPCQFQYHKYSL